MENLDNIEILDKDYLVIDNNKVIGFSKKEDPNYLSVEVTKEEYQNMFKNNSMNHIEYYYVKGVLVECDTRTRPIGCKVEFNPLTKLFEEKASLEEQIEYYKNLVIEKTREHEILKISGFIGTQEEINLQIEIDNLKQMYLDRNHKLALEIDKRFYEMS